MNAPTPAEPYSVSRLTEEIRQHLESQYDWLQVQGELSGVKRAASGHLYFSLKDANALLSCVAWKQTVVRWGGLDLQDGQEVIVGGRLSLYAPRGQYQLVASSIRLAGVGPLQLRFEAVKRQLQSEGLFDPAAKKPLPDFPQKIALITSSSGAALRDVLKTLRLYECPIEVTLCPVRVQGAEAIGEIARMIERVDQSRRFDLIVLCRGGGSLEDLWAFNEEAVARAIYAAGTPILTGIGHQIDFSIADMTADHYAATPTAAAQWIADCSEAQRARLEKLMERFRGGVLPWIDQERRHLEETVRTLRRYHPRSVLERERQRLDERHERLIAPMRALVHHQRSLLADRSRQLARAMRNALRDRRRQHDTAAHLMHSYDPRHTLARGYAICRQPDGTPLMRVRDARLDQDMLVELADGRLKTLVKDIAQNDEQEKKL